MNNPSFTQTYSAAPSREPIIGPALVVAVWTVALMFIAAFVTHVPPMHEVCPPSVTGPLLISIMLVVMTMGLSRVPAGKGLVTGLLSGFLVGAMNLLIFGTMLADPDKSKDAPAVAQAAEGLTGLKPAAAVIALGFMATSVVVALIAAALGQGVSAKRRTQSVGADVWLTRLAIAASVAVVPLLLLGGLVTSTGSGLAVPDWPGTYGTNMFLYPIGLMTQNNAVFLEHAHRLYGAMVGCCTLLMAAYAVAVAWKSRRMLAVWALVLLALVAVQGYLGGKRVEQVSPYLAVLHGMLAQVFFAGMVAFAAGSMVNVERPLEAAKARFGQKISLFLVIALLVQLAFGALYRHRGSPHALWSHVGWSFVVVVVGLIVAMWCKKHKATSTTLKRVGSTVEHPLMLQFLIGWVALVMVLSAGPKKDVPDATVVQATGGERIGWASIVRTVHQANGAVVLAGAVLAAVWTRRLAKKSDN